MDRERLVTKLVAQDESAWRRYIEDFGRLIYAVSVRFGFDEAEQEDHFQDVCLSVFRAIHTLRNPAHLSSWTYNIAFRQAIDMQRRGRRATAEIPENPTLPALIVEPTILEDLEQLQNAARVLDALAELDSRCRDLLRALFLEEPSPSYEDISRREGIPLGSIGPTRARCLEKLKKALKRLSNGLPAPSYDVEPRGGTNPSASPREGEE